MAPHIYGSPDSVNSPPANPFSSDKFRLRYHQCLLSWADWPRGRKSPRPRRLPRPALFSDGTTGAHQRIWPAGKHTSRTCAHAARRDVVCLCVCVCVFESDARSATLRRVQAQMVGFAARHIPRVRPRSLPAYTQCQT